MKRIIKFPLIIRADIEVRTIEDLKIYFDLERVIEYFLNGKLKTWLEQRNYINEVALIEELEDCEDKKQIPNKLCEIFDVEYKDDIDILEMQNKTQRENLLKQFTDDEEWMEKIDHIAFNQEELDKLVENNNKKIYIAGDEFTIFNKVKDKEYIGINNPILNLDFKEEYKNNEKSIIIKNVRLSSKNKIDVCADISQNCDLQGSNIQTNRKFVENVRSIDIDDFELESRYSLEESKDIFIFDNNLICSFLQEIKIISLSSLKVTNRTSYMKNYLVSGLGCICKDKLIVATNEGCNEFIEIINILTLKKEKSYSSLEHAWIKDWDLRISKKIKVISHGDYVDIYTYHNYSKKIACKRFNINSGKYINGKLKKIEYESENEDFDIEGEEMYLFDRSKKLVCLNNEQKIQLVEPVIYEIQYHLVPRPDNIQNYIVSNGRIITIWRERIASIERYDRMHDQVNDFIVVYDLKTGKQLDIFKAHENQIMYMKKLKNMFITIDCESILKLWNIDTLEIISQIRLYESLDDYDYYDFNQKIKKIYIKYDELSDRILIRFFDRLFILG